MAGNTDTQELLSLLPPPAVGLLFSRYTQDMISSKKFKNFFDWVEREGRRFLESVLENWYLLGEGFQRRVYLSPPEVHGGGEPVVAKVLKPIASENEMRLANAMEQAVMSQYRRNAPAGLQKKVLVPAPLGLDPTARVSFYEYTPHSTAVKYGTFLNAAPELDLLARRVRSNDIGVAYDPFVHPGIVQGHNFGQSVRRDARGRLRSENRLVVPDLGITRMSLQQVPDFLYAEIPDFVVHTPLGRKLVSNPDEALYEHFVLPPVERRRFLRLPYDKPFDEIPAYVPPGAAKAHITRTATPEGDILKTPLPRIFNYDYPTDSLEVLLRDVPLGFPGPGWPAIYGP